MVALDGTFIALRRYNYNVDELIEKYPDGVPEKIIEKALLKPIEDVKVELQNVIKKLATIMGEENK